MPVDQHNGHGDDGRSFRKRFSRFALSGRAWVYKKKGGETRDRVRACNRETMRQPTTHSARWRNGKKKRKINDYFVNSILNSWMPASSASVIIQAKRVLPSYSARSV